MILWPNAKKALRYDIIQKLRNRGVESSILFPDLSIIATNLGIFYQDHGHPVASDIAERIITLPCHEAMTKNDVFYIIQQLKDICNTLITSKVPLTNIKNGNIMIYETLLLNIYLS